MENYESFQSNPIGEYLDQIIVVFLNNHKISNETVVSDGQNITLELYIKSLLQDVKPEDLKAVFKLINGAVTNALIKQGVGEVDSKNNANALLIQLDVMINKIFEQNFSTPESND